MAIECFECQSKARYNHHVVPKSNGGTRTVPLCDECHRKVHDFDFLRHRKLQAEGIAKAKAAGKFKGRKKGSFKVDLKRVVELRNQGMSAERMSYELDVTPNTVF